MRPVLKLAGPLLGLVTGTLSLVAAPAAAQVLPESPAPEFGGIEIPPISIPQLLGGTDPASLDPTPAPTESVPPSSEAADSLAQLSPPVPAPELAPPSLPPPGGEASETNDPCAATEGAGAPIAVQCGITPTEEGGVDVQLCVTVAEIATCADEATPAEPSGTPPTTAATNRSGSTETNGTPTSGATRSTTAAGSSAPAGTTSGGATLPFTGANVGILFVLGTALTSVGALVTRLLR